MANRRQAMTKQDMHLLKLLSRCASDTGMPLRKEPAIDVADLPLPSIKPGDLYQMEVEDSIRTKLGASKATSDRSACVF